MARMFESFISGLIKGNINATSLCKIPCKKGDKACKLAKEFLECKK